MSKLMVYPMSTEDIRLVVKNVRQKCGLNGRLNVPVCFLFEFILEKIFQNFEWEIVPDSEMSEEGKTFTGENKIEIRESVYAAACVGNGRARFTIMHEIGHLVLHGPDRVALCRLAPGEKLKAFEDPEWQANTFAAEFLMDFDLIQGMDYKKISESCGVTYKAAKTRIDKLQRRWSK